MDLYTTSFSYPRPTPHALLPSSSPLPTPHLNLPSSGSIPSVPLPNVTSATAPPQKSSSSAPLTTAAQIEKEWAAVQKLALEITSREGCLVTVTKEQTNVDLGAPSPTMPGDPDAPIPATAIWNMHLSGGYQSVMAARGATLREIPRENRTAIKVARTDILESPLATISPLKSDVRRRLDEIAADSRALISVLTLEVPGSGGVGGTVLAIADGQGGVATNGQNSSKDGAETNGTTSAADTANGLPAANVAEEKTEETDGGSNGSTNATAPPASSTNATVTYGLETERMCELVITGPIESVEIAKVRLLVMLDELVSVSSHHTWTKN